MSYQNIALVVYVNTVESTDIKDMLGQELLSFTERWPSFGG